jgi:hypothetical protein
MPGEKPEEPFDLLVSKAAFIHAAVREGFDMLRDDPSPEQAKRVALLAHNDMKDAQEAGDNDMAISHRGIRDYALRLLSVEERLEVVDRIQADAGGEQPDIDIEEIDDEQTI